MAEGAVAPGCPHLRWVRGQSGGGGEGPHGPPSAGGHVGSTTWPLVGTGWYFISVGVTAKRTGQLVDGKEVQEI